MSTLGPTPSVMSSGTDLRRLLIPIALLVPGGSYFALIVLSVFGVRSPARWLLDELITTGWSACILLGIVIGCPMLNAAPIDISGDDLKSTQERKTLSLTTNDFVRIQTASGATAVVQFTSFGPNTAFYRWRYRAPQSQTIQTGVGRVVESYDRKLKPNGKHEVIPKADHETTVRAGPLKVEWSYGSTTNGWLYNLPSRAKVEVLRSDVFRSSLGGAALFRPR